jgi:hypothetical protein
VLVTKGGICDVVVTKGGICDVVNPSKRRETKEKSKMSLRHYGIFFLQIGVFALRLKEGNF